MNKKIVIIALIISLHNGLFAGSFPEKLMLEQIDSNIAALNAHKDSITRPVTGVYDLNKKIRAVKRKIESAQTEKVAALKTLETQRAEKVQAIITKRKPHYQAIIAALQQAFQNTELNTAFDAAVTAHIEMVNRLREKKDWGPVATNVNNLINSAAAALAKNYTALTATRTKIFSLERDLAVARLKKELDIDLDPIAENILTQKLNLARAYNTEIDPKEDLPKYGPLKAAVDRLIMIKDLLEHSDRHVGTTPAQLLAGFGGTNTLSFPVYKNSAEINQALAKAQEELKKFLAQKSMPGTETSIADLEKKLTEVGKTQKIETDLAAARKEETAILEKIYPTDMKLAQEFFRSINAMYSDVDLKKLGDEYAKHHQAAISALNNSGAIDTCRRIGQDEINLPTKRDQVDINTITVNILNAQYDLNVLRAQESFIKLTQELQTLEAEKTAILDKELSTEKKVALKRVDLAIQRLRTFKFVMEDPENLLRITEKQMLPL